MARKSNFIGTTETGSLSALGNQQQRDYDFMTDLIKDPSIMKYFAEPSVQQNHEKIDWYSPVNGKIKSFEDFTVTEIEETKSELGRLSISLKQKARAANNAFEKQAIDNLSILPDQASIKKVGNQLVIINWAYQLHKRERGSSTHDNFAGLAKIDAEELINQNVAPKISDEIRSDETTDSELEKQQLNDIGGVNPIHTSSNSEEHDNVGAPELEEKTISQKEDRSWTWFWLILFFILLILNILLLKDACGVRFIPFLNFC